MPALLALALLTLLAAAVVSARQREAALRSEIEELRRRLDELVGGVEASRQESAEALSTAGVAESMLLEKGIADEEEVEDLRRRLEGEAPPSGDDAVH